ncbi:DNA-binding transcriptional regulator CsiR [Vreelandella aquamarina]
MPSPVISPAEQTPVTDAKPASTKATDSSVRENLGIRAYQLLKNDIIKGFFSPGEKLRMHALKAHYDLGISPLREALSQLVAEHLVVAISQRGYRVAPMSLAELHDIYDARAQLEAMLLGLAIERGDDAWESEVVAKAHHLSIVSASNTPDELLTSWDERHSTFHTTLVSGCNSSHLLQVRAGLFDKVQRYRHLWLKETVFSEQALEQKRQEHAALVDVTLARQKAKAMTMMHDHLMTPVPIITDTMHRLGLA